MSDNGRHAVVVEVPPVAVCAGIDPSGRTGLRCRSWPAGAAGRATISVTRNEAVRSQLMVMMADAAGAGEAEVLVNEVVSLVLETMGVESPDAARVFPSDPRDRRLSTHELAALRAAAVVDKLEPLTAVADAAERYRKAVRKGKGQKKARKKLFESVEAWKESRAAPSAPVAPV
ncbi:MAG TPA: hypothetical protein VG032_09345 [Acidimicrobiales bacterium]|jgi:hypothetical protein|nr:hypothetical protein [Acidimicrobiales bacterium]